MKQKSKSAIMSEAKNKVLDLIKEQGEAINFMDGELYLIDEVCYFKIMLLDDELLKPIRYGTKKLDTYSISKIVSILNPGKPAYWFNLTVAKRKASQVKDQEKCKDRILKQKAISKNFHEKKAQEQWEKLEATEILVSKSIEEELERTLKEEDRQLKFIEENMDRLEFLITNYETAKDYGQVNYKYVDAAGQRGSANAHISIVYPSLLIYKEADISLRRNDIQIEEFLKTSKKAFGNLYYRIIE